MNEKRQTVLFVDDEQNVLNSLRRLFFDEPFNMYFAENGADGLDILKKKNVDIVISDVRMPGMDGIAFLKQVKDLYPQVIRIFLSGYADHKAVVQAFAEGAAQQLLPKPWKDEELKEIVRGALRQAEEMKKKSGGLQRIINSISSLPPMPQTYLKIKECLLDIDNISIDYIAELIEQDTSISAELLRWANSALFGQRHQVDTVKRAVLVLGFDIVEGLVLSKSIFGSSLADALAIEGFNISDFQTHSIACGITAKLLVGRISTNPQYADRSFTAGLLHDIGKLVEAANLAEQFIKIINTARQKNMPLIKAEFETLGTTHGEIGGYLADWWNLPTFLVNAVRWHHEPALCKPDHDIIAAVHVADILIQQFEMGASGNFSLPDADPESFARFDLTDEQLPSIKEEVIQFMSGTED